MRKRRMQLEYGCHLTSYISKLEDTSKNQDLIGTAGDALLAIRKPLKPFWSCHFLNYISRQKIMSYVAVNRMHSFAVNCRKTWQTSYAMTCPSCSEARSHYIQLQSTYPKYYACMTKSCIGTAFYVHQSITDYLYVQCISICTMYRLYRIHIVCYVWRVYCVQKHKSSVLLRIVNLFIRASNRFSRYHINVALLFAAKRMRNTYLRMVLTTCYHS